MAIDEVTAPSRVDPFVRDATTIVGGPVGRHARLGGAYFWTPLRVLVALTCLTFLAGFGLKTPCSTHPWGDHYQYTRLCYSDVFALYFSEGINDHKTPYVEHDVEYPVVIGGAMWLAGEASDDARDFFNVTAAGLLVCAVATVLLVAGTAGRRRPWDAALFALAPGLLLHGTTNWDLIAVALSAAALWAWSRRQPALAGLWLGLGVATKLYPALFLVGLFFLCWRAARLREWLWCALTAVATTVLVYLPVVWAGRTHTFPFDTCDGHGTVMQPAWQKFFALNRCRPADWDSLAFAWQRLTGKGIELTTLNLVTAVAVLAVVAAVGLVVMTAPRRPRVAQVLFLLLAGFLLVNKVNSPQYTLWLIPLAALARPRWGAFLAWQASEALVMFTRFYFFVWEGTGHADGIDTRWFVGAVLLRDALLVVLMGLVIREIFGPYHDVVRRDGEDDPGGGVLDGTLDRAERADDEWLPAARPAAAPG